MKVGDYVRTDNGCICKILKYVDISDNDFYVNTDSQYNVIYKSWIVKSSPNIIDLIGVGDYVNGYIVIEATPNDKRKKQQITIGVDYREYGEDYLENKDIKSVITKERFSQMEYKVGE